MARTLFITKFAKRGVPKAIYNEAGERTGEAENTVSHAVMNNDGEVVGRFSLDKGQDISGEMIVEVVEDEFKGVTYYKYVQGWKSVKEFDDYADSFEGIDTAKEKNEAITHLTA